MTIENLDIPADSIKTVGTISTTDSGALLSTATQLDLTFYYHLCQEIIGCDTLFFCKGDANLGVEVTTKFIIDIGSTPKGEPNITFDEFSLHLSIPSKKGLCLFLSGLLDTAVPILNDVLNIIVPNILTSAFDRINALNQTVALPDVPFDLYWALTDQTGTSIDGIGFQLILDVLIKSLGNQPGPFYPDPALPPILTLLQQEQVTLDFTDSLLNNLIDAIYLAENRQFSFKADGWDVKLNLESQPVISFTDGAGSDASELVFKSKAVISKKLLRFTVTTTITTHFAIVVTPQGLIYLVLDPDDFVVFINSIIPPVTNATKEYIQKQIENVWAAYIPTVNAILYNHSFQLPGLANFGNPELDYYNGFVVASFDSLTQTPEEIPKPLREFVTNLTRTTFLTAWNGGVYPEDDQNAGCPNISGGGFGKCT
eukprot:CAMPEP_0201489122 /NCGR_PEP_ID=MMETSP0151_2-20130828/21035_1 /ASSEMBLY_ACC=CAM_ASM_000257 /TAXON_ID=200890 /ORGANISM="Paramoeba atlantica, Strain 621/1 / CCAP 1560/9" /LENGTH=426 /DNA_ID=CAMNT_0047874607 /DNA_START=251 /DNA_END=1531 /DNA_ORIENTATION=-